MMTKLKTNLVRELMDALNRTSSSVNLLFKINQLSEISLTYFGDFQFDYERQLTQPANKLPKGMGVQATVKTQMMFSYLSKAL